MQILELVLYGKKGQKRTLTFNTGKVNIITGKSKSGKSAVGDIIEYCMGGSSCHIAEGVVRDNVSWYGLLLQINNNKVFVARKNPDPGQQTTYLCYYAIGTDVESPETTDFVSNTNVDGIEELLTRQIGISENAHHPEENESRNPLQANIRHSLFYCFQSQDEVAARTTLFHRQAEDSFITQAIKDTLPYFLGAVKEDAISLATEKRMKERHLKLLQRELSEKQAITGTGSERAISLIEEAVAVGLITDDIEIDHSDFNSLHSALAGITLTTERVATDAMDRLSGLQAKLEDKREELRVVEASIDEASKYLTAAKRYNDEKGHQKIRLESIGLFDKLNFETGVCPLCSGSMNPEPPSVAMMKKSIKSLDRTIGRVEKEKPKLRRFMDQQQEEANKIQSEITNLKAAIEGAYNQIEDSQRIRNLNDRRAKVYGRISYWLDNVKPETGTDEIERKIKILENRISDIESLLGNDSIKDRTDSALSVIQNDMTQWTGHLDMEYIGSPYRIDLSKATVVVDTNRPVALRDMGSASNWLGSHLIAMFGLHKYFHENNRPVPGFLFLDQPSQVYFPEGTDEKDMDIQAVSQIYDFIRNRVEDAKGKLQVIVVDHAKLETDAFKTDTIEEWRDANHNLVPAEWYMETGLAPVTETND